jgi:hypothetical protein
MPPVTPGHDGRFVLPLSYRHRESGFWQTEVRKDSLRFLALYSALLGHVRYRIAARREKAVPTRTEGHLEWLKQGSVDHNGSHKRISSRSTWKARPANGANRCSIYASRDLHGP